MIKNTFIGYILIFDLASLVGNPICIASSAAGLKICAVTARYNASVITQYKTKLCKNRFLHSSLKIAAS